MNFLNPTTQLEAINLILSTIGASPISSLDDGSSVDASQAQLILDSVSRQIQQRGWWFNVEEDYPLSVDLTSKNITVPMNTLKVISTDANVVLRGRRLYDLDNHTYQFTDGLNVELTVLLPFDELPEAARNLITQRAGRMFQERMFGSDTLSNFTKLDESIALSDLVAADIESRQPNMLKDSTFVQKLTGRK